MSKSIGKKFIVFAVLLMVLFLSGCTLNFGDDTYNDNETTYPESVVVLDKGTWPENEYTKGLPVPKGTVAWAMIDTENNYCGVNINELQEDDYNAYMEQLKEKGFSVVESTSQKVVWQKYISSGTLMSDGEKYLAVSYIPDSLVMYVSKVSSNS